MAVKKRGDNRLVLLAVAALLLIALFAVWMNGSQKQQEEVGVVSRPQVTPKPIEETIENGVYINHTFGFKFEYPEEVFDTVQYSKDFGNGVFMRGGYYNTTMVLKNDIPPTYILNIYYYKPQPEDMEKPGYGPTLYYAAKKVGKGDEILQYDYKNNAFVPVGTKLSDLGHNGVFYEYKEHFEDHQIGVYYYSADWLVEGIIISLKVTVNELATLQAFRPQFETLLQSVEFIEN